jgi:small-conductance mechanosensitive channel
MALTLRLRAAHVKGRLRAIGETDVRFDERWSFGARTAFAVVIAGLLALTVSAVHAAGLTATAVAKPPALPESLTQESARDLVSRLSDEQVRSLLLEQLDRAAAASSDASAARGKHGMMGMAGVVDQHAQSMRDVYADLDAAFYALPATLAQAWTRITGADAASLPALARVLALMLAAGAVGEIVYRYALRPYRRTLRDVAPSSFSARAVRLAIELLIDAGALAVFVVIAVSVFFAMFPADELPRIVLLETLLIVVVVRVAVLVGRFLLATRPARPRLLPFDDVPAQRLRRYIVGLALVFAVAVATRTVLAATGANAATIDVVSLFGWSVGLLVALSGVWRVRRPIADLIRRDSRNVVVIWIAELWPVAASAYLVALMLGGVFNLLAGTPVPTGTGFGSVLLVIALPIVDMALCHAVAAFVAHRTRTGQEQTGATLIAYEPIFRHALHIVVTVVGLLMLAKLWDLDVFQIAQHSLGARIAGSLLTAGIVVLATYMLWEIVRTAIDRRLSAEGTPTDDAPASRLRTVLPILRATIFVTILVMAVMSVLAGLGVDILPLIAGAGVVGVAIGFGSQTLVRDIVSGAFYLMDDAFRLGEYIEVGNAKGRVEKINVRSVFLRHHRGPINILPYGEIKQLRNTSRDWQVHILEFRLPYETSMLQVKNIVKKVGDELAADEDYAADLLQPPKSVGVISAEDSAVVVRVKFTARPGNNQWVIRRVTYDKIIRAFREAGIRFANRQVTVAVPASEDAAAQRAAGAAALALETAAKGGATD